MCGIAGAVVTEPKRLDTRTAVGRAMLKITHRGPDDRGLFVSDDGRCALAHTRLAIIDLSPAGRQPMSSPDGRYWITFNGEIYNHESLRPGLEANGHRYRSRTDTETVIHLYEERGLDFVSELDGDFAIGLWDEDTQRIVLARDRVGVKPLYYTASGGRLIFASEIKAILRHPSVSRDIDEEALYHYLTFLATPVPRTLFAGIQKLPAGCLLTCDSRGDIKVTRYWDAIVNPGDQPAPEDEGAIADEVRRLLRDSIAKRMMSDVPFGVFLSGGIDSSANVALMAELMNQPVRTFTVGFRDNPEYNEIEEARFVARQYGTDHHEILITQQDLIDFLPDLVFHQDEPIADPVCVPLYYVSKLARETGTKVIQVGEGSDELFCGYEFYTYYLRLHDYAWRYLEGLPSPVRKLIAASGTALLRAGRNRLPMRLRTPAIDLLRRFGDGEEMFWSGAVFFDETYKRNLFTPAARNRLMHGNGQDFSSYPIVRADLDRLLAEKPNADLLERMIYQELKLRLPELLLMRVDKMTMATSVEARVPFLDHKLVEFAMTIPRRMKYQNGVTKSILKRALAGVLPDRVLERKKKGFGAPVKEWILEGLGDFVEDSVMNSPLRRRELFDYGFVRQLLDDHRAGRANYGFFLWSLFNLSLWYDLWIEGAAGNFASCSASGVKAQS